MTTLKQFILSELEKGIKSDEQMLDKFLWFTLFWKKSAIVKKWSSFIRELKKMNQRWEIKEVIEKRIERPIKETWNKLNSAEIFYKIK